jgi:cytochrome c peroxidase
MRTALIALASPLVLWLAACGGGGSSGASAATTTPTDPAPVVPTPDPTPKPDLALESNLRTLAARANAGSPPLPPPENPDLVALGQALFFDRVLSGNRDTSCATCHDVRFATGDALSVSIGTGGVGRGTSRAIADGALIARNAPPLFRLAGKRAMFRDSRVEQRPDGSLVTPEPALNGPFPAAPDVAKPLTSALAAQAMFPVASPEEMRGHPCENEVADASTNLDVWDRLMVRLVGSDDGSEPGIDEYRDRFARAFPGVAREALTFGHAARAIAAFEATACATRGSAFDAWLAGDATALTDAEKRGGVVFFDSAGCARCHGGPMFEDARHHAIGVPQVGPGKDFAGEDTGRGAVTGDPLDRYRFRTPSLRNVAITGPWMHDGAYTTLDAAVRHYLDPEASLRGYDATQLDAGLRGLVDADPTRQDARAAAITPLVRGGLALTEGQISDLLAFLGALTDAEALDVDRLEPASVPSGLPLSDTPAGP